MERHLLTSLTSNDDYPQYLNSQNNIRLNINDLRKRRSKDNLVGSSARGYSGNGIPIMVSPDNGNATCNCISPVAKTRQNKHYTNTQPSKVNCGKGNASDESKPGRNTRIGFRISGEF